MPALNMPEIMPLTISALACLHINLPESMPLTISALACLHLNLPVPCVLLY